MGHNLETLMTTIEKMPLFGELREQNPRLEFGQYITVLAEWFETVRREKEAVEKDVETYYQKTMESNFLSPSEKAQIELFYWAILGYRDV